MYIGPRRRRSRWPWLVTLALILLVSGYYFVRNQGLSWVDLPLPGRPQVTPTPTEISSKEHVALADRLVARGSVQEAIAEYRRASELDPTNSTALARWARLLVLRGRLAEGLRTARRAVEIDAEKAENQAILGMALDWNGEISAAIEACLKAVDLDPNSATAYAYLAEAYADRDRLDRALQMAEKAILLDAESYEAHRNLGYVLERRGDYDGAIARYTQALSLQPNLVYLTVHDDMAGRDKTWDVFRNDPEWKKLSADPAYANTVSASTIVFLRPASFSQI